MTCDCCNICEAEETFSAMRITDEGAHLNSLWCCKECAHFLMIEVDRTVELLRQDAEVAKERGMML